MSFRVWPSTPTTAKRTAGCSTAHVGDQVRGALAGQAILFDGTVERAARRDAPAAHRATRQPGDLQRPLADAHLIRDGLRRAPPFWQANDHEGHAAPEFLAQARRVAARIPFAEDLLAAYYCAFDRDTPLQVKARWSAPSPISCCRSTRSRTSCRYRFYRRCRRAGYGDQAGREHIHTGTSRGGAHEARRSRALWPQNHLAHHLPRGDRLERGRRFGSG